jgi:hypothetical protein
MQSFQIRVALAVALLAGAACYPKSAPPPATVTEGGVAWASAKWPAVTEASLAAGRDTFVAECNACHDHPDLSAIPDDRWPAIVERMGKKADLDAATSEQVLQFVLASKHP